jgi:hypothetical protein
MNILIYPLYGITFTLLYYDMVARKEGGDMAARMQQNLPLPGDFPMPEQQ